MNALASDIILNSVFTLVGLALGLLADRIAERFQFKKELRDNNDIDVSGMDWIAAWQTSVDGELTLNTEKLCMVQKGQTLKMWNQARSPENPKGGFLWEAQLKFFHGKSLMGWYFPRKGENITSKGIMFLSFRSQRKLFIGKWVGASYDGDLSNGFVVISKLRETSLTTLKSIIAKHTDRVNIVYDTV